jgi:hypothetical protein
MGTLRSGLEEMQVEDVRFTPDSELEESLVEIERAGGVLEAERARRVAEAERRASYRAEGYLSATSWLSDLLRVAASCAARYLRWARALERMPLTRDALSSGEVSSSAAAVLVGAAESDPEEFEQAEPVLVDAARNLPVRDLARAVAYWRWAADAARAEEETA